MGNTTNTKRQHMNLFKTFAIGLLLVVVVVATREFDETVDEEMPESAFSKSPEDTLTQSKSKSRGRSGWWHRHRRHKPAPAPAPARKRAPSRKCPICPFGMFAISEVQVDGCPKCKPIKRKPIKPCKKCKKPNCPKCEEFANEYEMVQGKAEDQAIPCMCPPFKCRACKLPKPKPLPLPKPLQPVRRL